MKRFIIHYYPQLKERARQLRNESTQTEIMLWKYLKRKQRLGYDFHRQKPLNRFIVDFYCNELFLAIEIDGMSHDGKYEYDKKRQKRIECLGVKFLRFTDDQVKNNMGEIIEVIDSWILKHTPSTHPSIPSPERMKKTYTSSNLRNSTSPLERGRGCVRSKGGGPS